MAKKIALERAALNIKELANLSNLVHSSAHYAPTGGNRVSSRQLDEIRQSVRICAQEYGYPAFPNDNSARAFDIQCSVLLYEDMYLHSSEASHIEMWAFMTCVLLPDVVRWRFSSDQTSVERFIGSDRGLRRNAFGRLWWRSFLLHQPDLKNPYMFLQNLVEDDLVQITERNSIAASRTLLRAFCSTFLQNVGECTVPRRALIREASKRVRRLLSLIAFDALDSVSVNMILKDVFSNTIASLESNDEILP
jgi:hypothetical protein